MTENLFGVIPKFGPVSSISLALPYIFCLVNGEILTKNMRRSWCKWSVIFI